ncbi:MAG: heme exporter protein CcmD [Lysobacteraceae bacterium]
MSYLPYVIAAYAVFAVVLGWDYLAPRLQVRAQLRAARLRAARRAAPAPTDPAAPLSRQPGERRDPV